MIFIVFFKKSCTKEDVCQSKSQSVQKMSVYVHGDTETDQAVCRQWGLDPLSINSLLNHCETNPSSLRWSQSKSFEVHLVTVLLLKDFTCLSLYIHSRVHKVWDHFSIHFLIPFKWKWMNRNPWYALYWRLKDYWVAFHSEYCHLLNWGRNPLNDQNKIAEKQNGLSALLSINEGTMSSLVFLHKSRKGFPSIALHESLCWMHQPT